jgi:hypothetical protein
MLGVTLFGLLLTPVFYYVVRRLSTSRPRPSVEESMDVTPIPQL